MPLLVAFALTASTMIDAFFGTLVFFWYVGSCLFAILGFLVLIGTFVGGHILALPVGILMMFLGVFSANLSLRSS